MLVASSDVGLAVTMPYKSTGSVQLGLSTEYLAEEQNEVY